VTGQRTAFLPFAVATYNVAKKRYDEATANLVRLLGSSRDRDINFDFSWVCPHHLAIISPENRAIL
jgi:hypothetical protein